MYPYQWVLGKFAYPTHNLSKSPDKNLYIEIDGSNLEKVEFVSYVNIRKKDGEFKTIRLVNEVYKIKK